MIKSKDNFYQVSDGAWIYYEDYGSGDPIVILHGYLCSSKFFSRNIAALSENHRLILVDWRGHGSSSKTLSNLTMDRCAKDIHELMDHLSLENATLLGWSMGSSVVMEYYEQFGSDHLKKIGVIDSALYPFSGESWNSHALAGFHMDGMNAALERAATDHDGYTRGFARICFKNPPSQEDEDWVTAEMKKLPVYIAFALYNDFLFKDYTSTLTKIDIPLMICCADSPAIPSGIAMGSYYRDLVKGNCFFHAFEGLGHVMFWEDPPAFHHTILSFVEEYE